MQLADTDTSYFGDSRTLYFNLRNAQGEVLWEDPERHNLRYLPWDELISQIETPWVQVWEMDATVRAQWSQGQDIDNVNWPNNILSGGRQANLELSTLPEHGDCYLEVQVGTRTRLLRSQTFRCHELRDLPSLADEYSGAVRVWTRIMPNDDTAVDLSGVINYVSAQIHGICNLFLANSGGRLVGRSDHAGYFNSASTVLRLYARRVVVG